MQGGHQARRTRPNLHACTRAEHSLVPPPHPAAALVAQRSKPPPTCSSPSARILMQMASVLSVPKASSRSSRLASTPLDTLANTAVVCSTSSRSLSLQQRQQQQGAGGSAGHCGMEWQRRAAPHPCPSRCWQGGGAAGRPTRGQCCRHRGQTPCSTHSGPCVVG